MSAPPITFNGQVAIVTGAGHGLGRAYALELAARGAAVVCNDVVAETENDTARTIAQRGGSAVAEVRSVATSEGGAAIVQRALDTFGGIDVVINNAGQLRNAAFDAMTVADFDDVIGTHLGGAFHVTQPAYREMQRAGYGRIVFILGGRDVRESVARNYAAAKAGLVGLCNVVALEGARHGIAANAVMPMALTGHMTVENVARPCCTSRAVAARAHGGCSPSAPDTWPRRSSRRRAVGTRPACQGSPTPFPSRPSPRTPSAVLEARQLLQSRARRRLRTG